MKRACVIGHPVAHSRSPMIHGHWLKTLGLTGAYTREDVPPDAFEAFALSLAERGYVGANVTIPNKEAAFKVAEVDDPVARALGVVNTLWLEGGKLRGMNTDVPGFLHSLDASARGWDSHLDEALVLGAGGAARAIVHALLSRGAGRVTIANRTLARAEEVAALSGSRARAVAWSELQQHLARADVVVNTTSLGMKGQPPLDLDLSTLHPQALATDIVYVPLVTPFLIAAEARGNRVVGGLGMLLHQAAPGFEKWFGVLPEVTPALRALVEADVLGANGS